MVESGEVEVKVQVDVDVKCRENAGIPEADADCNVGSRRWSDDGQVRGLGRQVEPEPEPEPEGDGEGEGTLKGHKRSEGADVVRADVDIANRPRPERVAAACARRICVVMMFAATEVATRDLGGEGENGGSDGGLRDWKVRRAGGQTGRQAGRRTIWV